MNKSIGTDEKTHFTCSSMSVVPDLVRRVDGFVDRNLLEKKTYEAVA
jgi:hypothetical protein